MPFFIILFSKPEVDKHDIVGIINKNIRRLYVKMHHAIAMNEFKSSGNLPYIAQCDSFGESAIVYLISK